MQIFNSNEIIQIKQQNRVIPYKFQMIVQNPIIKIDNFSYFANQRIGEGATGRVYRGFRNIDQLQVAVKIINTKEINTPVKSHLLHCQIQALRNIRNKYICDVYDVMKDREFYYVPMQLCPNGNLRDYIQKRGSLPQNQALPMFQKIIQGYSAIVKSGFIHRDLKTQNILLRANMDPVIIDFGYCQKIATQGRKLSYNVGSPAYMSPQAYNQSVYSEKSDIWALGIVLHQMLTGTIPVMRTTDADQYFRYLARMPTAEIVPGIRSEKYKRILLSMLTVNPHLRPSVEQIKNMLSVLVNGNYVGRGVQSMSRIDFRPKFQLASSIQMVGRPHNVLQSSLQLSNQIRSNSSTKGSQLFHMNSSIGSSEAMSPLLVNNSRGVGPNFGQLRKRLISQTQSVQNPVYLTPMGKMKQNNQLFSPGLRRTQTTFKKGPIGSLHTIPLGQPVLGKSNSSGPMVFSRKF